MITNDHCHPNNSNMIQIFFLLNESIFVFNFHINTCNIPVITLSNLNNDNYNNGTCQKLILQIIDQTLI